MPFGSMTTEEEGPIQILQLIHSGAIGGGPRVVYDLATHFNQGIWRSIVICSDDGPLRERLQSQGVRVVAMNMATKWRALASIPALTRTIRHINPRLIHVHGQFAGFVGGIAARLAGYSDVIYTAHFPSFVTDWDLWRCLRNSVVEKVSCRCAKSLVCVCRADLEEYIRRGLVSTHNSGVIYNGVAIEAFSGGSPRLESTAPGALVQASPVLGFVGRLTDQKGVDVLLRALPTVQQHYARSVLLIAGDGPLRQSLENLTRKLGIEQAVRFLGFHQDVPRFLTEVDLLVVPSLYEPFGFVALEGMASGTPVVASQVGGLSESVVDGVTGKLVPAGDPAALAKAVVEMLADPVRAHAMGLAGKERVQRHFSRQAMLGEYERVYRTLVYRTAREDG